MSGAAGNRLGFGFDVETLAGTVNATPVFTYVPVNSDQTTFDYDANRQPVKLAIQNQFSTIEAVEMEAKGTGKVMTPLFPSNTTALLALWGLGGGALGAIPSWTAEMNEVYAKFRYPGNIGKGWKISAGRGKAVEFTGDTDFVSIPIPTDTPAVATYAAFEKPYVWSSTGPATAPGFTAFTKLANLEITGVYNNYLWYGNHGNNLPSDLIVCDIDINFQFEALFLSKAAYALYIAQCMVPGDVNFTWQNNCGGVASATMAIDIANGFYQRVGTANPMRGAISQTFQGWAKLTEAADFSLSFA